MPKIPYGAIRNPEFGNNTFGSFLVTLADKALELNCAFYRHDSSKFLRAPENSLGRILWNWICEPYGDLPPPPEPPFLGGQCDTLYTMEVSYEAFGNTSSIAGGQAAGPLKQIWIEVNYGSGFVGNKFGNDFGWNYQCRWGTYDKYNQRVEMNGIVARKVNFIRFYPITPSIPDACGNPPPEFLPPEGNPPNTTNNFTFNYTNYDNTLIEVEMEFISPNYELNIRPSVNIGNLNLRFDIDGIEITKRTDIEVEEDYPILFPEINNTFAVNALDYTQNFNELNSVTGIIDNSINDLSTKVDVIQETNNNLIAPIITDILDIVTNIDNDEGNECPDYTEELEEINDKLQELLATEIEFPIAIGNCTEDDEGNPIFNESTIDITANKYLASGIMAVNKIATLESKKECLEANKDTTLAVPEWWASRIGADRPQILAIFRKANTRNYHSISIPHPQNTEIPATSEPLIPAYTAGNYQGTLFYKDGSKFIINCISIAECERIINIVISKIKSEYLFNPLQITYSERKNGTISESLRIPISLKYYSTGQKNLAPDWIKKVVNI